MYPCVKLESCVSNLKIQLVLFTPAGMVALVLAGRKVMKSIVGGTYPLGKP